jgi:hypothetical protein
MKSGFKYITALAISLGSGANAAVVIDKSPDAIGFRTDISNAPNSPTGPNYLAAFTLNSAATLDGASIYTSCTILGCGAPDIGTKVLIKFRSDIQGAPAETNLFTFDATVSAIDFAGSSTEPSLRRVFASFTPTAFDAGRYWFGMSGEREGDFDIGWNVEIGKPSEGLWQMQGDQLAVFEDGISGEFSANRVAFQLEGEISEPVGPVPEPATWGMMILGFGLVGAFTRRHRAKLAGAA